MNRRKRRKRSVPGKHAIQWPLLLTILLLLLILSPWLLWLARPNTPLSLLVYNKSVPARPPMQHTALGWILHHYKVLAPHGEVHRVDVSYRGYHPENREERRIVPLGPIPEGTDMVYIADTYGVYRNNDDISRFTEEGVRNLIYGGVDQSDVDAMRSFLNRDEPNTLIAEYNTFATPTPDYIQTQLYEMFRVEWTGWTGLFVADLAPGGDAPLCVYAIYESAN